MRVKIRTLIAAVVAVVVAVIYLLHDGDEAHADAAQSPTVRRGLAELIASLPTPESLRLRPIYIEDGELRLEGQAIDQAEHPIAGATITLNAKRTTTTEADGSFAFDNLAAADYRVTAEKDTYYGEDSISLDATSDPLELKLVNGPALVVHVRTQSGGPIVDAKVEASGRAAVTGRDGTVRLRGLELDGTLLDVSANGYATWRESLDTGDDPKRTIDHTVTLGTSAPIDGIVIDEDGKLVAKAAVELRAANRSWNENIDADDNGHWRIETFGAGKIVATAMSEIHIATPDVIIDHDGVHAKTGVVLHVERGATITGVVVDTQGKGIADASVNCSGGGARSDEHGRFTIKGLSPGENEVSASAGSRGSQIQKLVLARGGHDEVAIVLVESSIAGVVTSTHGEPLDDIQVYARSDTLAGGFARSDEHGHFDLGGLQPGEYELVATRNTDRQYMPKGVHVSTGTRDVKLVVQDVAKIVGRVVLDGKPVDYFGVAIYDDPDGGKYENPDVVRSPDGRFEQHDLRPGRWHISIVGPSFMHQQIKNIEVTEGQTVDLGDIAVARGRGVRGRVTDGSGVPVENAVVALTDSPTIADEVGLRATLMGTRSVRTDALGHYEIDGIAPDATTLKLQASDEHSVAPPRELAASDEVVDLVLRRTGSIDGIVVNARPHRAHVLATASDGMLFFAQVDAAGEFKLDRLPAGDYKLELSGHGTIAPQQITVVADAAVHARFELPPEPIALAVEHAQCKSVTLRSLPADEWLSISTCTDGVATFDDITPGTYEVCIEYSTCAPVTVAAAPQRQLARPVFSAQPAAE